MFQAPSMFASVGHYARCLALLRSGAVLRHPASLSATVLPYSPCQPPGKSAIVIVLRLIDVMCAIYYVTNMTCTMLTDVPGAGSRCPSRICEPGPWKLGVAPCRSALGHHCSTNDPLDQIHYRGIKATNIIVFFSVAAWAPRKHHHHHQSSADHGCGLPFRTH